MAAREVPPVLLLLLDDSSSPSYSSSSSSSNGSSISDDEDCLYVPHEFHCLFGLPQKRPKLETYLGTVHEYSDEEAIVYADGVPIGGGALISCNLVLTTAYLVQDYTTSQLEVKLGKSNLNVVSSTERSYKVYDKVLHPRWDQDVDLYSFDLALLQLDSEIDFATTNGYINAVCLPDKRTDTQGLLTLTGFGYDDSGRANAIMQEVNIKKQPQDECPLFRHKPYAFCGVGRNAGICTGDRGSPVVQLGPSGQFTLVGVANDYQCTPGFPDVYTQISYFLQFICNVPTGF